MKTIHDYLESLFLHVPITPETKKAKEDLSAIMEDHYHELISQGKSEHEAIGAVISEFGSVDELLQALEIRSEDEEMNERDWDDAITFEEASNYWKTVRYFSLYLSIGIGCCVFAFALFMFFVAQYAESFGLLMLLALSAVGVGFIISSALKYSAIRKSLEDRLISKEIKKAAKQKMEDYEKSFRLGLVLGIGLCIFSLAPVIMSEEWFFNDEFGLSLFLMMVALGVFFIVYVSVIRAGYAKLVKETYFIRDEDHPGTRATKHKYGDAAGKVAFFQAVYWPLIVVMYMLWSFAFHAWAYSWVIFMIGGILQDFFLNQVKHRK